MIWGLTWIAIKFQLGAVDSNVAVFYRFAAASLILFILAYIKKNSLHYSRNDHLRFLGQGFFMFCLNFLLTYWASSMAPSAIIALAFTSLIYFNMFFARLFLRIPFERKVIFGALVSFAGMGLISYNELLQIQLHPGYLAGFLISLFATVSASLGNIISARSRQLQVPIIANNAWGMFYGCLFSLAYCVIQQSSFHIVANLNFILSFAYLVLFGTIISFGAYLKLIDLVGPAKAAFTSVVSPVIAIFISILVEKMDFNSLMIWGVVFCLIGNVIALAPKTWLLGKFRNAY